MKPRVQAFWFRALLVLGGAGFAFGGAFGGSPPTLEPQPPPGIAPRPASVNLTESEAAWLKAHPQVRWGADPRWPPFSSLDPEGKLAGIDSDITRLVAERVGMRLALVHAGSWAELFERAKTGEVDFLSATARTPEREEYFAYTHEYGSFPVVIVIRDNGPFLTSILQLRSMTLAQQQDYVTTLQLQRDFPTARMILTDTAEQALGLVVRGKADATLQNLAVATRIVRTEGLANLKISGVTPYRFPLRFAVRKDAPELVSILNKGLATITPHEEEIVYAAHLTPDIGKARNWSLWRNRALYTLFVGTPLIIALAVWNALLIQQVRQRKAAELSLREAHDHLAAQAQELKETNEDLKAFSTSASHDLRAPLRRLNSFAGMLAADKGNELTQRSRKFLGDIADETRRMDQLIHDLLQFARLGRGALHQQAIDMSRLVQETIEEFRPQWQQRDVHWNVGSLGEAYGDPRLLRVALANLIDNALKYTRERPHAEISIAAEHPPGGSSQKEGVFYIRDNGVGFDPEQAEHIFKPFHRLQQSRQYEGTGIGLANARKIIQKHHGRIWFESRVNEGATFFFSLPTQPMADGDSSNGKTDIPSAATM